MKQKQIERNSLIISSAVNFLTGVAGITVFIYTGMNSLFLDSVFSIIAFFSSVIAVFISKNSHKRTKKFPQGLYFLEPLYAVFKSIAILFLLMVTLIETSQTAYSYFFYQIGQPITTGPVLNYTFTVAIMCLLLGYYNRHQNKKMNNISTILAAESKGNIIDGLISLGIGLAVLPLYFFDINSQLGFLHYTGDFFICLVLIIISIKDPIMILIEAFGELTHASINDHDIIATVEEIIAPYILENEGDLDIHIHKQGMRITVSIYILSVEDTDFIQRLAENKASLLNQLRKKYHHITVEYTF
jgi:divalent metal cation (Fe/Co/Zn/Cd) transporter